MTLKEQLAKQALSIDEDQARTHLRHRQQLGEQLAGLEVRLAQLASDLEEMTHTEKRLEAKLLELKAVGHREKLARLEKELKILKE